MTEGIAEAYLVYLRSICPEREVGQLMADLSDLCQTGRLSAVHELAEKARGEAAEDAQWEQVNMESLSLSDDEIVGDDGRLKPAANIGASKHATREAAAIARDKAEREAAERERHAARDFGFDSVNDYIRQCKLEGAHTARCYLCGR